MEKVIMENQPEKCEAGDIILLSIPSQYRCKKCGNTWFTNKPTPNCLKVKPEKVEDWKDDLRGYFITRDYTEVRVADIEVIIQKTIQEAIKEYADETIPAINEKWRKYVEEAREEGRKEHLMAIDIKIAREMVKTGEIGKIIKEAVEEAEAKVRAEIREEIEKLPKNIHESNHFGEDNIITKYIKLDDCLKLLTNKKI